MMNPQMLEADIVAKECVDLNNASKALILNAQMQVGYGFAESKISKWALLFKRIAKRISNNNSVNIASPFHEEEETFEDLGGRIPPIDLLPSNMRYADEEENDIDTFLTENRFLIEIIKEVVVRLERIFEVNLLRLEYFIDYEEPQVRQLFILIPCKCSVNDALDKLDEFDKSWWYDNLDRVQGKLGVDVVFDHS